MTSARILRGLTLPVLLLAAWEAASRGGFVDHRMLPPIEDVAAYALREAVAGELLTNIAASLERTLLGCAIGVSAGLVFGLLLGLSRTAAALLDPSFQALKQIAVFAWIPLISLWLGVGEAAKIAFVAAASFTPVVLNAMEGVRGADQRLCELAQALTLTRLQKLRRLYLPSALPSILTGLQIALIHAWLATIGAEYFMTVGPGVGGLIIEGRDRFNMEEVLVGVLLLAVIGYAVNISASALGGLLLRGRTR